MKTNKAMSLMFPFLVCLSIDTLAATWGQEKWGQMYWGSNPTSAPTAEPAFTIKIDGDQIIVEFTNYTEGNGEDGWSAITGYVVSCAGIDQAISSNPSVALTDLDEDTEYNCTVKATNALGDGPTVTFAASTSVTPAAAGVETPIPVMPLYALITMMLMLLLGALRSLSRKQ